MKRVVVILAVMIFFMPNDSYAHTVQVRPDASIGYCKANDMEGLSYTYGIKILLMANEFQRYGLIINHLNILADEERAYLTTGIFIEQVVFKYFNMGIGTVGYINTIQRRENPFGLYTHLGFEYNFNRLLNIVAAYQSEFIFRKSFTMNNAFMLGIDFKF